MDLYLLEHLGSVYTNYIVLEYDFNIIGEYNYPINHCLIANKGVQLKDIKLVISHSGFSTMF